MRFSWWRNHGGLWRLRFNGGGYIAELLVALVKGKSDNDNDETAAHNGTDDGCSVDGVISTW
jgi:hypothetical protein